MRHALTIDVEDWFQVLNMQHTIAREDWDRFELRCIDATRRILDLLDRRGARATFFFLGWIAERAPELVRDVVSAGHEIGSHGYDHQLLDQLGAEGFAEDLRRTARILEKTGGTAPTSFRACTWSVTARTSWALPTLVGQGYRVDSSVFPIRHPDYGVPGAPLHPYRVRVGDADLLEVPPLCLEILGRRLPVGGGGYLRLFPLRLLCAGIRQQERAGWPACIYLHPWEVDPEQPRQRLGGVRGFRHYVNLHRTLPKLERLLERFAFVGLEEAVSGLPPERLPAIDADDLLGPVAATGSA